MKITEMQYARAAEKAMALMEALVKRGMMTVEATDAASAAIWSASPATAMEAVECSDGRAAMQQIQDAADAARII